MIIVESEEKFTRFSINSMAHTGMRGVWFYKHGGLTYSSKSERSVAELSCVTRKARPIVDRWECENGGPATFAILEIDFGESSLVRGIVTRSD